MKKYVKNNAGLTLLEVLAGLVIFGVIASFAFLSISNIISSQRDKAILSDFVSLIQSAKISYADHSCGDDNICEYSIINNEIKFISTKFDQAYVDFTEGDTREKVILTRKILKVKRQQNIKLFLII